MAAPTNIPVIEIPYQGGINVTDNLIDAATDMSFINDGYTILVVSPAAVTPTLTIYSVADDVPGTTNISETLTASKVMIYGPFEPLWWNTAGSVFINFSSPTSVKVGCFSMQS
jgi:hypothetical protein